MKIMYNIIPLILILMSLGVIIVIVVKKFSVLANLDVESIQAEREARFKEQIISNRLKRSFFRYYAKVIKAGRPIASAIVRFSQSAYRKLVNFKENYNKEQERPGAEDGEIVQKLFAEADEFARDEKFEEAEKKYIGIISRDSKNVKAFRGLGRVYLARQEFNEARQTLEHVLRLLEQEYDSSGGTADGDLSGRMSAVFFDLALVCLGMDNTDQAASYADRALEIEPHNPRYLDTKLQISIMEKDKAAALEAYERLAAVNPDNNKLPEFGKKIEEL